MKMTSRQEMMELVNNSTDEEFESLFIDSLRMRVDDAIKQAEDETSKAWKELYMELCIEKAKLEAKLEEISKIIKLK